MSELKTIIFDLGGVLLSNDDKIIYESEFLNTFHIGAEHVVKGWRASWNNFKTGKISEDIFWEVLLKTAGASQIDITKAKRLWRKHSYENENMFSILKVLQKHYTLGVLSNIGKEHFDYKRKYFQLDQYFTFYMASGYEGVAKPDISIYELLLKKVNMQPQECLFIDDLERNLLPARQLGMGTILFETQEQLRLELESRGLYYE